MSGGRLHRFFQHARLGDDWAAPLVVALIGTPAPWTLALDRTNWTVDQRDVNILMLALATRRFRVPVLWSVLDKAGTSNAADCVALMERFLARHGRTSIHVLLADREFTGLEWLAFLVVHRVPFAIRITENRIVDLPDGGRVTLRSLLKKVRKTHGTLAKSWFRVGFDERRRRMRTDRDQALAPLVKALKSTRVV